jgi:transposase
LLREYPAATIAMEACSGSNYWGRTLQQEGYKVRLIPPQYVKPFVKGNKNDRNDALAITEAARRPRMRFVQPRSLEQTDLIQLHRVRERLVRQRTALVTRCAACCVNTGSWCHRAAVAWNGRCQS